MGNLSEHFDAREFACQCGCGFGALPRHVNPLLIEKFEAMREFAGPMKINSGCRCPSHNLAIGGSPASAHTRGEAADINCPNSQRAYVLLKYAFLAGFRRIGIERGCIHLDVSSTLPQDVAFGWERQDHI